MSGHNKWSQIKRKKEATDAKKSKVFSLLAKAIAMEASRAAGDKNSPSLKAAIERARAANLPNENIDRAIKRATEAGASDLTEVMYEAYGPGGAAIIIEGITDNKNRTAQEIKHILNESGVTLAAPGSATWAFEKTSAGWRPKTVHSLPDKVLDQLRALVEALENHGDVQAVSLDANLDSSTP